MQERGCRIEFRLRGAEFVDRLLHPEFHGLVQDHEQKFVMFAGLRVVAQPKVPAIADSCRM
jgi:hypothetical protein